MIKLNKYKIQIYLDGANTSDFKKYKNNRLIKGFTTNPSLMRKAGVKDYEKFCKQSLKIIINKPISFEIFADETKEIENQAKKIATWGKNIFVKIPVINTKNKSNSKLIGKMNMAGVKINVTAVFTIEQTKKILKYIGKKTPLIISVFSGRIADTGLNPSKDILRHIKISKNYPNVKILWASVREVYNIVQAESVNCDIITIPAAIFEKLNLLNKNLTLFSVETVKTFYEDAKTSKFKIN